jgi:anti-sigma regulatory factor (Ser/Thr protein kinase)
VDMARGARAAAGPGRRDGADEAGMTRGPRGAGAGGPRMDGTGAGDPGVVGSGIDGSGVVHAWTALALPSSPRAAGRFRRHAVSAAHRWGLHPDSRDVVETCVSELVTNAIVHGVGRDVLMMLYYTGDSVLTEVFGQAVDSPAIPATARSDNAEGGRGLLIVESLAKDWGSEHTGLGLLRVWASIAVLGRGGAPVEA